MAMFCFNLPFVHFARRTVAHLVVEECKEVNVRLIPAMFSLQESRKAIDVGVLGKFQDDARGSSKGNEMSSLHLQSAQCIFHNPEILLLPVLIGHLRVGVEAAPSAARQIQQHHGETALIQGLHQLDPSKGIFDRRSLI